MLSPLSSIEPDMIKAGALLLVDKPATWTSFDAVNRIKNLVRKKFDLKKFKVGHSGTLDPMATGLLLICTGSMTKELFHLQGLDKKYEAEIMLGIETDSYDADGKIVSTKKVPDISQADLALIVNMFSGELIQVPPIFSAIKKDGKPLYELARAGKEVLPSPRNVFVHSIELSAFSSPRILVKVHSGSGFYVRSLAHDIGEKLDCGAHLTALRRTAVGGYELKDAFRMDEIVSAFT